MHPGINEERLKSRLYYVARELKDNVLLENPMVLRAHRPSFHCSIFNFLSLEAQLRLCCEFNKYSEDNIENLFSGSL